MNYSIKIVMTLETNMKKVFEPTYISLLLHSLKTRLLIPLKYEKNFLKRCLTH